jgi:hypothetical protein
MSDLTEEDDRKLKLVKSMRRVRDAAYAKGRADQRKCDAAIIESAWQHGAVSYRTASLLRRRIEADDV